MSDDRQQPPSSQDHIVLTFAEARAYGILCCTCGHPENNHFGHGDRPCAHCDCKKLDERRLRHGRWVRHVGQRIPTIGVDRIP